MVKEVEKSQTGSQSPSQKRYCLQFWFLFYFDFDLINIPSRKASSTSLGSQEKSSHETAQVAFKLYDRDKDGYITKAEMVKISKTLTKEQVEKVCNNFSPLI